MCCMLKICFNGCTRKPIVYTGIQLVVSLLHIIILAIAISPYTHCEKSETFKHDSLILYQRLNCSEISKPVADNAVILTNNFDLMRVSATWIILNVFMIVACIIFMIGICANIKCCISSIFVLPFICVSALVVAVDIVLMIILSQTYRNHTSDNYFHQLIGVYDKSSKDLLRETMRDEMVSDVITITRIKTTNLFYRLLYHVFTICCLVLALKEFVAEMCQSKREPKDG